MMQSYLDSPQYRMLLAQALKGGPQSQYPGQAVANMGAQIANALALRSYEKKQQGREADYGRQVAQLLGGGGDVNEQILASGNPDVQRDFAPLLLKSQLEAQAAANQPITPYQQSQMDENARRFDQESVDRASEDVYRTMNQSYERRRQTRLDDPKYKAEVAGAVAEAQLPSQIAAGNARRIDEGYRPPSGYRVSQDGTRLEPIPGGPEDPESRTRPSRAIPSSVVKELADAGSQVQDFERLRGNFKPEFGGNIVFGGLENTARRMTGDSSGQAQWWQDYQAYLNIIRNKLFGSALTLTEKNEFEKAMVTPRMASTEITKNLDRQQALANRAAQKLAKAYAAAGYGTEAIEGAIGIPLQEVESLNTGGTQPKGRAASGGWKIERAQ